MTRVLVVDDKSENLYYLRALLTGHGFVVEEARHGAEALVIARSHPPDLVVSDLLMPVMDGYTLLRYWKSDAALRRVPFIVYTATYTEEKDAKLAMDLGADAFILKPAEPEDFLGRMRDVMSRHPVPEAPHEPPVVSDELLQVYSEALIRKLEEKSLQLEDANRRLARSAMQLEMAGRMVRLGGWWFEVGARHVVWSDEVCRIHGEPEGTAPDLERALGYYEERDRPQIRAAIERALRDGTPWDLELELIARDGRRLTVRTVGEAVRDELGRVVRVQGAFQDVTERRETDRRLRQQAALLDKAQDAILVRALDDTILYWNKSAERLYGWTAAEAIGRNAHELINAGSEDFVEAKRQLLANGEWKGTLRQLARDGRRVVTECRWTVVRSDAGEPESVLAINTDVTDRRSLEQQFLRAQRLESIGTLAGGIAHDLNNVLSPVMMSLDLLRDLAGPPGEELVDGLRTNVRRGADLVRQVLNFARGLDGRKRRVDLRPLLREIETVVRDTFPKNIRLDVETTTEACCVLGDSTQLHQVMMNLLVNARDAMPLGGTITLRVLREELEGAAAVAAGLAPGHYVRLDVVDDGEGISPEHQEVIFEPFFTTKEVGQGTGLGLSTVQSIVKGHDGAIHLESELGKGSRFSCWFPMVGEDEEQPSAPTKARRLPRGEGQCILVVDDEDGIRAVAQRILGRNGYRVHVAANGREGIEVFRKHRAEIDAIVTDVAMPEMDGPEFIAALRAEGVDVPIIVSSGYIADEGAGRLMDAATEFFISKPFTSETLLTTIRGVLVGRV